MTTCSQPAGQTVSLVPSLVCTEAAISPGLLMRAAFMILEVVSFRETPLHHRQITKLARTIGNGGPLNTIRTCFDKQTSGFSGVANHKNVKVRLYGGSNGRQVAPIHSLLQLRNQLFKTNRCIR